MIKVSVILPCYNAELTVSRMLDSLLVQTLQDFEVIAIDDGSTDGTLKLLKDYGQKDARVKVLTKVNEGVAIARQLGVANAQGEYSIHADSDDWVEPTMLEEMYQLAKAEDADVVIADFFTNKSDGTQLTNKQQPTILEAEEALKDLFRGVLMGSIWHKLIRTSFYKKGKLRFYKDLNYCEDHLVCAQLFKMEGIKIAYMPKAYYHYFVNNLSITHTYTRKNYDALVMFQSKLAELLPEPKYLGIVENAGYGAFINGFISNVITDDEINAALTNYKRLIQKASLRWRVGFIAYKLGFISISHKLIHF